MRSGTGGLLVQVGRGSGNGFVLFVIAVFALLSAFPTYAKTNPSEVRLAVLMPTTGTFGTSGRKAIIMAQIAAEDVVTRNLLNDTSLRLISNNTGGIGNTAAKLSAWHIQNGALALYGGVISGETLPISFLATSAQIPNINPSAAAPDFSDKTAHEYHVRTIPSDEKIGAGLLAMAAYFKWDGMVLLNGDDSFGRGLNDYLIRSKPTSMQLLRYPFAVPPAVNESVMIPLLRANLQAIRSSGVRVIILHMQAAIATAILKEVQASGMLGPPFVFVGTGWCSAPTIAAVNFSPSQLASLNGLTCCITHTPDDSFVASLTLRAKAKDAPLFATGLTARELSSYDGVIAFATATANMFANQSAPNSGTQLLRELKILDIPGALGRIRFDSRNDLLSFIDVINFQNGTFIARGTWDESTNNLTMATLNVWPDGTTNVPRAIPKDYYDGDLISAQWDARVVVTAVAIGILGSFTTVILLEQAVSRQLKQARAKTSNQKESKETGARLLWLVASSASLGGCAIWCSVFIELSGMTLGPVTPQFQPFNSLIAIPCGILAIFFGLFAAMPETDGRTSRPSSDDKALKSVAAERPGARPATAAGPVPSDQMALGRGASKRLTSPFRTFLSGLTRWTFIGGIAVGGGIVLVEVVCLSALDLQAEFTTDSGLVLVGIIVALAMSVVSVIIFFHVKGVWRFTSSILFTAGILVSLHLMFLARQYVYRPFISHDEDSWNTGNITIICAASAAATEFLLMLLNVTKLKNTRNQLDRLLSVAQDQMARMEADLDSKKQEIKDLIREGEAKDTMLELINLVRPLYRPQALAFALTPSAGSDLAPPGLGSPASQTRSVSHFSLVDKEGQPKSPQQDMKTLVKAKSTARVVDPVNSTPTKNEHEFMRLLDDYISMSLESGPVAFRATQDVKLNELMQHPVTVEILKDWLQKQMCPENVALLLDIQRYKMLTKYSSRRSMGQAIYASFIQADAPHEVNLGAGLKAKLLQSLNKKATLDVFDDVEHEIMNLITTNNMEAFTSSHQFKLCCVILGHPSYKRRPRAVTTAKSQVEQSTTGIDFTATGAVGGRPANDGDNSPRAVVRSPMEKGSKRTLGVGGSSLREAKDSETRGLASGQLSPSPMPSRQIPESKVDPSHAAGHNVSLVSHPEPTPAIPTGSAPVAMFFVPSSGGEGESQVRTVTNFGTAANAASTTVGPATTATATSDGNAGGQNSSIGSAATTNNGASASSQTVGTPHGNNNLDTPSGSAAGAGVTSASAIQLMPLLGTSATLASDSKSA